MSRGWKACLFGGVVRDVFVKSPWVQTRDIDIVVSGVSLSDLEDAFHENVVRKTRFGGVTLNIDGWLFDMWPLEATWGLQFFPLFADRFELLPLTTFFSVEAIAVELSTASGTPRTIYQERFVESVERKSIMLNLRDNPFPELCIVRAFVMARKLNFSLDVELVRHLAVWAKQFSVKKLERVMVSHYGRDALPIHELRQLVSLMRNHADCGVNTPLSIPRDTQMQFSFAAPEPVDHFLTGQFAL